MAPFSAYPLVEGFKERIECLTVHGDKLYVGTSVGTLHVYTVENGDEGTSPKSSLSETKTRFCRKSVDQLGYIKELNSLVVLTEGTVSLHSLPTLAGPPTTLAQTKGSAAAFAIDESVQRVPPSTILNAITHSTEEAISTEGVPTVVTVLAVGCKRRIVIYTWKDGEAQPVQELALPHTPRVMAFPNPSTITISYNVSDHATLSLSTMTVADIVLPTVTAAPSVPGMGAFSGLSGYMTLGMGAKPKAILIRTGEGEIAFTKDNAMLFYGADGKTSRESSLEWPAPPEDAAYFHPFVISILPTGSLPAPSSIQSPSVPPAPAPAPSQPLQIRSSTTLKPVQTLHLPHKPGSTIAQNVRLLTVSPCTKPPVFLVSTSADKAAVSTIWSLAVQPWAKQFDELIEAYAYDDALALLDALPEGALPDKDVRYRLARALRAVQLFHATKFNEAIDTFLSLDTNPALVIGLYPGEISGPLCIPPKNWIEVFGGKGSLVEEKEESGSEGTGKESESASVTGTKLEDGKGSITGKLIAGLEGIVPGGGKDDETASVIGKARPKPDDYHRSIEALLRYLPDRRQKVIGAFSTRADEMSNLPWTSLFTQPVSELQALPSVPPANLPAEQLLRVAQIVDTALFKSYLVVRPALVGSLCRLETNWCEVSEVETELKSRKKYGDLIDLYRGKKMHDKALQLLHELSADEPDTEEALGPTIRYLQRLGVQHLDVIFASAEWVFKMSPTLGLQIFTADLDEVDSLPRRKVADYLQRIDPTDDTCIRYLEHVMGLGEDTMELHEMLADLYLEKAQRGQDGSEEAYQKFLKFIDTTTKYRPERLLSHLPPEDLFEARAILLGRLGRHEGALQIYVNRLKDYGKAENYCKRVHDAKPDIFLTLLRLYLAPGPSQPLLLTPALSLIAHHSIQLEALATLGLLPPLVSVQDVSRFLSRALKDERRWSHVEREVRKSRGETVAFDLVKLQERRVKVEDSRICPQCQKKLGNSVIAVHAPSGEVTHYRCREAFAEKLMSRHY